MKRSVIVTVMAAVSLLCTAAFAQIKTEQGGVTTPGVDRPGSDIQQLVFDAPAPGVFDLREYQCSNACWLNESCLAWTYVRPGTIQGPKGNCWLKSAIAPAAANACCVSGTLAEPDTNRSGGDYRHFDRVAESAVTPRQCQAACFHDTECRAWTYVKPNSGQGPNGNCWLKKTVPPPSKNACCISGYFEVQTIR
jgi:hypothetical protein